MKEFIKVFESLAQVHGSHRVWSDFITMSACALSNRVDERFAEEREQLYMQCVSRYSKTEAGQFAELLGVTMRALWENPEQDFLGTLYSRLGLHNGGRGQFFTPYHIASLIARMNMADKAVPSEDELPVRVSDPCCGAGCLLIAYANEAQKHGIDKSDIAFYAQDIDQTAALMCYIQLSLLGCNVAVKVGNSLANPITECDLNDESVWLSSALAFKPGKETT